MPSDRAAVAGVEAASRHHPHATAIEDDRRSVQANAAGAFERVGDGLRIGPDDVDLAVAANVSVATDHAAGELEQARGEVDDAGRRGVRQAHVALHLATGLQAHAAAAGAHGGVDLRRSALRAQQHLAAIADRQNAATGDVDGPAFADQQPIETIRVGDRQRAILHLDAPGVDRRGAEVAQRAVEHRSAGAGLAHDAVVDDRYQAADLPAAVEVHQRRRRGRRQVADQAAAIALVPVQPATRCHPQRAVVLDQAAEASKGLAVMSSWPWLASVPPPLQQASMLPPLQSPPPKFSR